MRKDHRPYYIKRFDRKIQKFYTRRFLRPQMDYMGKGCVFIKPWHVEIFGPSVKIGNYATIIAASDKKVRLSVWTETPGKGAIKIGSYCLVCPGVRMGSSHSITIGDNCMLASGAYITDSDWHGIYNRVASGKNAPVKIEDNVWIGDSAIICKGVTIGKNSIVGAGAVVTKDIPANVIAAGNSAKVIRLLDPEEKIVTRSDWLYDPAALSREFKKLDKEMLRKNTIMHWLKHLVFPGKYD